MITNWPASVCGKVGESEMVVQQQAQPQRSTKNIASSTVAGTRRTCWTSSFVQSQHAMEGRVERRVEARSPPR